MIRLGHLLDMREGEEEIKEILPHPPRFLLGKLDENRTHAWRNHLERCMTVEIMNWFWTH